MPSATSGEFSIEINASAHRVYAIASDVTGMGERSPECDHAEWLDGATGPSVGARFRGHNHLGPLKWSTTCEVTSAVPGKEFAFHVVDGKGRVQTRWRYVIDGDETRARLTESYEFVWCPLIARLAEAPIPRDQQLRRGIEQTLRRIKERAERGG
jgi:hypothetical protein